MHRNCYFFFGIQNIDRSDLVITEGFSGCQMSCSVRAGAVHVIALNQRCMKFISDRLQESRIDHFGAVTLISEYNLQTDFALYGQSDGFEYV